MIEDSRRVLLADKLITEEIKEADYSNHMLQRVSAKGKTFKSVDFKYTIFETCYFRKCIFDRCNFTGCRFIGCNLNGARFTGCTFDYTYFERTIIEPEVLDNCCPGHDNLKMRFARTLRMNFQQIGDAAAVNKAIMVELAATENTLLKAWKSNESYYRFKYQGLDRLICLIRYAEFKLLDFTWGNGESLYKLLRSTLAILIILAINDVFVRHNPLDVRSYLNSMVVAPQIFVGTLTPQEYTSLFFTVVQVSKLVIVGFFMSIIIKRFNRR